MEVRSRNDIYFLGVKGAFKMQRLEMVSKPPLGLNPPKADKSLC